MAAAIAWHVPGRSESIAINGVDLHYSIKGSGEPVLLVHGFGSCASDWGSFADELAKTYRVILVDMRGHGLSTNPSGRFTHRQSAEDIRSLLEALRLERTRAIGFSSGGMSLLHLAIRYPDVLSKLVVVSATTHFPESARRIMRGVRFETLPPPVREQFVRCAVRGEDQARQLVAQFHAFKDSYDDMNLTPADLARIEANTLIVHGDRDEFFPVSVPVAIYQAIPRAQLWIVPNGDHSPMAGASADMFERQVTAFLAK
jgi:pimeloyl-ACP methyl ester carboxylesterase